MKTRTSLLLKVINAARQAVNEGRFENEIVPVEIPQRQGDPVLFSKDEEPFKVKFDKVASLKGAFVKDGTVTAANASTINDGACRPGFDE